VPTGATDAHARITVLSCPSPWPVERTIQVVKERLGHGSITTTEKYLHSLPGTEDAAVNALARIRGTR
jgi:hypothetical protein